MTNYEKIKAMSIQEMGQVLSKFCFSVTCCDDCVLKNNCGENEPYFGDWDMYLESEVET